MGWQAVQHYNVAAFERRNQAPLQIRHEGCSVHRSIKHEGCDHPPTAQPGHEGEPLPMSMGTWPINRMPRGQRPRTRTILVEVAVSSINTSRAGSNMR